MFEHIEVDYGRVIVHSAYYDTERRTRLIGATMSRSLSTCATRPMQTAQIC
jgi:hypothetical protein